MGIKIEQCNEQLQRRIKTQIAREDAAKAAVLQPVGGLADPERQHVPVPPLVNRPKVQRSRKKRVVVIVTVTSVRNRETDDDNIIAGAKPLRDAIAKSLAVDDGDRRIEWEYRSIVSKGKPGTHVTFTKL